MDFTRPNSDSAPPLDAITVRVHRVVDGGLWGRLGWLDRESKHLLLCVTLAPRHTYQLTPGITSSEANNDEDVDDDCASSSSSSAIECKPTSLAQLTPDLVVR